jgi:hypothetical protein
MFGSVLYENNAREYINLSEIDKSRILVERVETMLLSENSKFFALQQQSREHLVGQGQPQPAAKTTEIKKEKLLSILILFW